MSLPFVLPQVFDHPTGWGPHPQAKSDLDKIPYAPFNRSDRVGRIADWTSPLGPDGQPLETQGRSRDQGGAAGSTSTWRRNNAGGPGGASGGYGRPREAVGDGATSGALASAFTYQHAAEEEESFSVVDRVTAPPRKSAVGGRPSGAGAGAGRGNMPTPISATAGFPRPGNAAKPAGAWGASAGSAGGFASVAAKPGIGSGAGAGAGRGGAQSGGAAGGQAARRGPGGAAGGAGGRFGDRQQRVREPSIKVGPTWTVIEELDFPRISKLYYEFEDPEDISIHGSVQYVDRSYERVNAKNERPLQPAAKTMHNPTASQDPILQELAKNVDEPTVFATDSVLAALMTTTRSVNSWDIIVTRRDNVLYLDKRDGSALDLYTVNENASEPPMEGPDKDTNINSPLALAHEATQVNRAYAQQILRETERVEFVQASPFAHGEPVEAQVSAAQRYRRWQLGDVVLVARTQLDAAITVASTAANSTVNADSESNSLAAAVAASAAAVRDTQFVTVRALNEFDSRAAGSGGAPDWRLKLDSQRGAVMATEFKNNANKLCRWICESVLAGADQFRLGFVSRATPRERRRHVILGSSIFKPREFAANMNFDLSSGWGLVKAFIDLCFAKLDNGKFVLLRDPNKPVLRLYKIISAPALSSLTTATADQDGNDDDDDKDAAAAADAE
eukprot:jgi/Hompol1/3944/HPOL_003408-RA